MGDDAVTEDSGAGVPARHGEGDAFFAIDTRNAIFEGYERRLPHWRGEQVTYFVTWRVHPDQDDLSAEERTLVQDSLRHFDGGRYHLLAHVVMNDHVHVLCQPFEGQPLERLVHSWKSFTANHAQRSHGRRGSLWQDEYFDRIVRDEKELFEKLYYVLNNPRKRWPEIVDYAWVGVHELLAGEMGR